MDRSPPGKQPQKARCEQLVAVNQRLHRRRVGGGLELLHDAIDPLRNDLPDYFTRKVILTHHLPKCGHATWKRFCPPPPRVGGGYD